MNNSSTIQQTCSRQLNAFLLSLRRDERKAMIFIIAERSGIEPRAINRYRYVPVPEHTARAIQEAVGRQIFTLI